MPIQLTKEYIAGFFDGEGSITITKPCKSTPTHNLYINIGQTRRDILEEIKKLYGGYISIDKRDNFPNRNIFYQLNLKSKIAERFLRDIYPYIQIKKLEIDIAFQFRETQRIHRGRNHPLTKEIISIRENLRLKLIEARRCKK